MVKKEDGYMGYGWIDEYLLSKTGVTKDLQKDWNSIKPDVTYGEIQILRFQRKNLSRICKNVQQD